MLNLAFEAMHALDFSHIVAYLHIVIVDLGVDGSALDDKAIIAISISHKNGEVAVIFSFGALMLILVLLLL